MSTPPAPNDRDPPRPEPSVVVVLLDRPVAEVARFCGQSAAAWLRGLVDPWGLGVAIAKGSPPLGPPFAFLVVALFVTGAALRLWLAIEAAPASTNASLVADLRAAVDDLSLTRATIVTLPCVLIVDAGGWLLGLLGRSRGPVVKRRVVAAAYYAVGWQSLVLAVVCGALIAMQSAGYEPAGSLNDEMNQVLPVIAVGVLVWGGLIVVPSVRGLLPDRRWWAAPVCLSAGGAAAAGMLVTSLWVLGEAVDLRAAARLRHERQFASWQSELNGWMGELQADVLRARRLPTENPTAPDRYELTIAYTSRSKQLLVAPRQEELIPAKHPTRKFSARRFRVVASSLDALPDRALLIDPGETRIAEVTIEVVAGGTPIGLASPPKGSAPYGAPFFRRTVEGTFVEGQAMLLPPREVAAIRLTDARGAIGRSAT